MNARGISISFQNNKPLRVYGDLAAKAEAYGFDVITLYNDLFYQPAWLPLMEIARHTQHCRIGVAAMNPFTSHPINIAGNIALINEVAGGRAYLGLTRGAWLDRIGVHPQREITALKEAFVLIRHLLRRDSGAVAAELFPLDSGNILQWPIAHAEIPFLLGAWGPRTIRACAASVTEIKLGGSANPDLVPVYRRQLNGFAAGRDVAIVIGAVTVIDEDGARARQLAKHEVALFLPVVAENDRSLEIEPAVLQRIKSAAARHDFDAAARDISDDLLRRFAFAGTAADIIEQTAALLDAGAARVEFGTPHGLDEEQGLRMLGEQVLPAFT